MSHALRPPAPAALTAPAPVQTSTGAAGARLSVAADPTNLLTDIGLADVRRLIASADAAARAAVGPATAQAPRPAAAANREGPAHSPWAWLWAAWESVASLYVALTEPKRRGWQGRTP